MSERDYRTIAVWAPTANAVEVDLDGQRLAMRATGQGWWQLQGADGSARTVEPGCRYAFHLDGGEARPDPRSLYQPQGVHGPSQVYIPHQPAPWSGMDLRGRVLYEMHIGTFTQQGTFTAAIDHLDDLVELGVEAVEVMPVAQIPGTRGWGYDGVDLYATQNTYGGPAAFQQFIDAAHAKGLGVILDVVYNHLGPEGNYLSEFGPYFNPAHETPWGPAINLDGPHAATVRQFLIDNARQWLVDFGLDGLRLDAVHALADDSRPHFLAELAEQVAVWREETGRPLSLIAESDLNQADMVTPVGVTESARGMDMQWADDIHHSLHAFFTGQTDGYYCDFGSAATLAKALTRVFVHDGGFSTFRDRRWGAPVDLNSCHYDGHSFVAFIQNHDQVGNRAAGDRLGADGQDPGLQAAAAALYLLGPFTPMLFMGEEWAASTPFPYFSHLGDELGPLVTQGRRREFRAMGWQDEVPDPQAVSTFHSAILDHTERQCGIHARMLGWYRDLLALRRAHPRITDPSLPTDVAAVDDDTLVMRRAEFTITVTRAPGTSHALIHGPGTNLAWREQIR